MMGYQSQFFNPYGFMQQNQMPQVQQTQVVRVNGENGAKAYNIGANSSALLLDESGLMVWLVTADGAGYRTVSAYDITPHQEAPKPDYNSFESRLQTVEKRLEELVNGTPKRTNAVSKVKSDDGSD
jgi:hypothetical protein